MIDRDDGNESEFVQKKKNFSITYEYQSAYDSVFFCLQNLISTEKQVTKSKLKSNPNNLERSGIDYANP